MARARESKSPDAREVKCSPRCGRPPLPAPAIGRRATQIDGAKNNGTGGKTSGMDEGALFASATEAASRPRIDRLRSIMQTPRRPIRLARPAKKANRARPRHYTFKK